MVITNPNFQTTSPVGSNTVVSKKLEACVFFLHASAWHINSSIILLHVYTTFHSHAANKGYDVLSEAKSKGGGGLPAFTCRMGIFKLKEDVCL